MTVAFGWIWMVMGVVSGLGLGLAFHRDGFLGGYDAWPRRLVRLGHIPFFGTGLLNVLYGLTAGHYRLEGGGLMLGGWALMAGGALMPVCCGLAAWRKGLVPLFALPVLGLGLGTGILAVRLVSEVMGGAL